MLELPVSVQFGHDMVVQSISSCVGAKSTKIPAQAPLRLEKDLLTLI